jgi:heat shock protein HslJ
LVSIGSGALVVVLAFVVALAVGGNGESQPSGPPSSTTTTTKAADASSELLGEWRPRSIAGYTGALTSPPLNSTPFVRFQRDRLDGEDGCNSFGGTYEVDPDGTFRPRGFGGTLVLCPTAPTLQDALADTRRVEVHGDRLTLTDGAGHTLAELARAGVSARIELPSNSMTAGSTMKGRIVVDNETGHVIPAAGCGSLFAVQLRNEGYEPEFGWTQCRMPLDIPTGVSTYPVVVLASILRVGAQGPLPPGHYEATLYQSTHVVPDAVPVPIEVVASP